jgi:prepilin-type N-terminal cleavage/methylation domain-containing protein
MLTNRFAPRGFTLIELLLVIAVIVILAGIAYPVLTGVQEQARVTQDMSNLRQIGLATQMYLNDNDGVLFSADASAGTWMAQLHPKYLPAWKIFQSPFDKRAASENGTTAPPSPVSYGLNGNTKSGTSIAGLLMDKIANPSAFIVFAPAQSNATTVAFAGTASPGVTVYKAASNPGGTATGGTHNSRARINALFADLHTESMLWSKFILDSDPNDSTAAQRWDPYLPYP